MQYSKFTFNPFQENTYIIWDETLHCVIIDPGCYHPQEYDEVTDFIKSKSLIPVSILNTHCHIDHVLGVSRLKDEYGIPFICHEKEMKNLERLPIQAQIFGLPLRDSGPEPDQILTNESSYTFGNSELQVLFVPGHSPGHLAFYHRSDGILIGGDVLFRRSVGRTDLPGCNQEDLIESIQTKFYTLPKETIVLAGHMEETSIGEEMRLNPYVTART